MPSLGIFPKAFAALDAPTMAATVRDAGLDAVSAVVRDRYWVRPGRLAGDLPRYIATMRAAGLTCTYAVVGLGPESLAADPEPLRILAGAGIRDVRFAYLPSPARGVAGAMSTARDVLRRFADVAAGIGVRGILQTHHGTLHASTTAAWWLVDGADPRGLGVKIDAGNQCHEGREDPARAVDLLADRFAALGVKDVAPVRDPAAVDAGKGWRREWAPIDQGETDWPAWCRALRARSWNGTMVFSPFYLSHDLPALATALTREVAYLRAAWNASP